jgi:hypothetical protein
MTHNAQETEKVDSSPFCGHGVWLGDLNPHRPCARCVAEGDLLMDRLRAENPVSERPRV